MYNKQYINIKGKKVPYIYGGKGGCFPAGALVSTPLGKIPIEHLKVDDFVYCYDLNNKIHYKKIDKVWKHKLEDTPDKIIKIFHEKGNLKVTSNHYLYEDDNEYKEAIEFCVGESLTLADNSKSIITEIEECKDEKYVYNLTVNTYHNFIADSIRLSNKGGGGKGGSQTASVGSEDPNTLFSTDILFLTVALGEGPVYRNTPNGPQDIEINEGSIDSLLELDSTGSVDEEFFVIDSRTGTLNQTVMPVFGDETVVPQTMSGKPTLKKGNLEGVPRSAVKLQNTSVGRWDALRFHFGLNALQQMDSAGNIFASELIVGVTVYDRTGLTEIFAQNRTINGKTNTPYSFFIDVVIPEENKSSNGYKFTIEKVSDDKDSSKIQDGVAFLGWDEITNDDHSYPRTALIGYAIKAHAEYKGSVPTFTTMVKGLICKVPSNYNQPVLESGEIDWRNIEIPESGSNGYPTNGYRQQKTGSEILTSINPTVYDGLWDGSFSFAWTQNPVWITYDLLTNTTYGLGISEDKIDKFKFYQVAQYCDAVDPHTGKWSGVDGIANGLYMHKPLGLFSSIRETLIGLNNGIQIKERRFICDATVSSQKQVVDIIGQIVAIFRGILYYSAGKITINADLPNELPVGIFNEGNILKDSLTISGIKESEILTGVEVSYIEPANHYRREVIRVDDPIALQELNQIENISQLDLSGVTRRGQAIRFAQYLLASSKYIRRKATFSVSSEALNVNVGQVIAVSQRVTGTSWGYGGRVASNSSIGSSNVILEHFTSPAITSSIFTANTNPMALRIIGRNTDRVELYLVANTISSQSATNTISGIDLVELQVVSRFKANSKTFSTANADIQFTSTTVPTKTDLWTLGEVNPSNYLSSTSDKLFKITGLVKDTEDKITITASEYISNVYTDSDTLINYTPVIYKDTVSPLIAPPIPTLTLRDFPSKGVDGSVIYNILVDAYTDRTGYPLTFATEYEYATPTYNNLIESMS